MNFDVAVVADYAASADQNKITINGIFREMQPQVLPVVIAQMFIVVMARVPSPQPDHLSFSLYMVPPNAEPQAVATEQTLQLINPRLSDPAAEGTAYLQQIVGLGGVPIQTPGDWSFEMRYSTGDSVQIPFFVNQPVQGSEVAT